MTTMAPKKTIPAKRHRFGSTSQAAPPPPDDPRPFISREAERLYHESLCIRSFVSERGFLTSNAFFNFTIQTRGWQTLCAPLTPGVALIIREFNSNLPFRVGTIVFVRGRWVNFEERAIDRFYQLREDDSKEYRALFEATDFEGLMQELTQGQGMWRGHPSTGEFTTFPMIALTLVVKVWYNFLYVKIKPSLHLSTVTKDKTILLYAMTKGLQFDFETVIEPGLIEKTHGRCTGAPIHPSLITELCRSAGVQMLDSEEQV